MTPTEHDEPEWDDEEDDPDLEDEDDYGYEPEPHQKATKLIVVETVSNEPVEPILSAGVASKDRWICSGPDCGATWKADPGKFHSHEVPVPGSKSRKTYENFSITKVGG